MGKKKNRQADVKDDASVHSSESGEDINSGVPKCPHIVKAISPSKLRKILKKSGISTECNSCQKLGADEIEEEEEGYTSGSPELWICLQCGNQACGRSRKKHAEDHFKKDHSDLHCLAINVFRWSIWCYECESEVNADSRKQLLEIVEFIRKLATSASPPPQPPIPLPPIQNFSESIDNISPSSKEKLKSLSNLRNPVGLMNLGNTCFFNSVMQCLVQTPFLVKVLEDLREPGEKFVLPGGKLKLSDDAEEEELPPIEGTLEGWGSFTSILCKTLIDLQTSESNQNYRPSELLNCFKKKNSQCMDGGQHDSHELLRHLLELVRNEDLRRYQSVILKEIDLGEKSKRQSIDDMKKNQVKFYGNQASARLLGPERVFQGVLVSTLKCSECNHSSQRTEPFLDLSLPVMVEKPQPPVFKRKNSGLEDNFDHMGNNVTPAPSKHQLKKDKKAARKNRKNRRSHNININDSSANQNDTISEENQGGVLESEDSDADVEDNIEGEGNSAPVFYESDHSSEKISAVANRGTPAMTSWGAKNHMKVDHPAWDKNFMDLPGCSNDKEQSSLNDSSPSDVTMIDVSQNKLSSSSADTPSTEAANDTDKMSVSLIANSEMSAGVASASPLSTPLTSEDSPTSPTVSPIDNQQIPKLFPLRGGENKISGSKTTFSEAETDECRSSPDVEQPDKNCMDSVNQNLNSTIKMNQKIENGIEQITSEVSKVSISTNNRSPTRYHVKDGDCSIQSCLNQFTQLELMNGSNKVGCEACTAKENKGKEGKMICTISTKQYLISKVPAVLILHLKRFQSQRFSFRKVNKHVAFPMVLDLAPVCKYHDKPKRYALYGLVEHSGTMHGGHYVAYVKVRQPLTADDPRWAFLPKKGANEGEENSSGSSSDSEGDAAKAAETPEPPPGRWYYVSDSWVAEVDEDTVLQKEAYLLFYERIQ